MSNLIGPTHIEINEENYFEIAEALHAVLTLWHDGKHGYVVLCKSQFRPGMAWSESVVEEENEYYSQVESLVSDASGFKGYDAIEELMDRLNTYIDTKDN